MNFIQNVPLFAIVLSLFCAVSCFVFGKKASYILSLILLSISSVSQGALTFYCYVNRLSYTFMMGHYPAPWGNELIISPLESGMACLFSVLMLLSVLGGREHIRHDIQEGKQALYGSMLCLTHAALLALCYTNDIFTGYVFIEILTISSCALLAAREGGRSLIASIRYMIFSLVGSGLFLIGVILLYSITGHLLFPQLRQAIAALWESGQYRLPLTIAIGLQSVGLAIKSGLFPFHLWVPDAHSRATVASSCILSGVIFKGYIVLLIKLIYRCIGADVYYDSGVGIILFLFGVEGMILCSASAIFAKKIKIMVAYSSTAQIGYVFMGLGLGTYGMLFAALLQIVAHAITKPVLFLSAVQLADVSGGRQEFSALRGAAHRDQAAGVLFTVGALSIVGLPLLGGFIPKLHFATAAAELGWQAWVVWLALAFSTILNVLYFLYTVILVWLPSPADPHTVNHTWRQSIPAMVMLAMNLTLGLHPQWWEALLHCGMELLL